MGVPAHIHPLSDGSGRPTPGGAEGGGGSGGSRPHPLAAWVGGASREVGGTRGGRLFSSPKGAVLPAPCGGGGRPRFSALALAQGSASTYGGVLTQGRGGMTPRRSASLTAHLPSGWDTPYSAASCACVTPP